jgi:hypothetical protein
LLPVAAISVAGNGISLAPKQAGSFRFSGDRQAHDGLQAGKHGDVRLPTSRNFRTPPRAHILDSDESNRG